VNKSRLVASLVATFLVVAIAAGYLVAGARPQLGLDLRGGISAVYTPVLAEGEERPEDFDGVLDETISVIRQRVDALGVAEPEISRQGDDVLVQLPGLDDADRAQEVIGTTAKLTFRRVTEVIAPTEEAYTTEGPDCTGEVPEIADEDEGVVCEALDQASGLDPESGEALPLKYRVGPAEVTGSQIDTALPSPATGDWSVDLGLDSEGAATFAEVTSDLACERDQGQPGLFAIVLDNRVESAPGMNPGVACGVGIRGGQATITVGSTGEDRGEAEARDLALVLRTGALPITLEPSTFETVSPTLGSESLRSGLIAGLLGLLLVAIYLVFFYRWLGVVAIGALTIFGVVMTALITVLGEAGFALTLAGIAGIVVSIGITADSSIIFFERIRDEVNLGKTMRTSVKKAFQSAFRTNLAGNTVTLAAAIILYFLAVGPVRGFALTLGIATVLDIIILYVYSRAAVGLLGQSRWLTRASVRAQAAAPIRGGVR
jgi:preprotein translocase subunit SecD